MSDYRRMAAKVATVGGPVLLDEAYSALLGSVWVALLSRLGTECLAEYTVAGLVQASLIGVLGSVGTGAAVLVARAMGAGDWRQASTVVGKTLAGVFGLGLVLMAAGWVWADHLLPGDYRDSPAAAELAAVARFFWLALPFLLATQVGKSVLQGMGATGDAFRLSAFCLTASLSLGSVLAFVWPRRGILAMAGGVCLSAMAGLLLCLILLRRQRGLRVSWRYAAAGNRGLVRAICRISSPVVIEQCFLQAGFSLFVLILVNSGAAEFAANQIAQQLEGVSLAIGSCLAATAFTLVGRSLGENAPARARSYIRFILCLAAGSMTACGLVFYWFAEQLVAPFSGDAATRGWAAACLSVAFLEQPTLAVTYILSNALRAAGDTKWPMVSTVAGIWLVRLPLCWLVVGELGAGIAAVWFITAADYLVRSVILGLRYRALAIAR